MKKWQGSRRAIPTIFEREVCKKKVNELCNIFRTDRIEVVSEDGSIKVWKKGDLLSGKN